MRTTKRILAVVLTLLMLLCAAPLEGFVEIELFSSKASAAEVTSGKCGDNVYWSYNVGTAILTISGEGNMSDYELSTYNGINVSTAPWYPYYNNIKSVVIEKNVSSIGYCAFRGFSNLTSITIPNSVTSIGDYAFWGCTGLTSIPIPNSVTSIGYYAFNDCTGLTSITIPDSVTSIESYAFSNCTGLKSVNISEVESWCKISFSNDFSNPLRYARNLYLNGKLVTDLTIPNGITRIGDYAFYGYTRLTSITIPNSVTSIGNLAFYGCTGLTSIIMPNSVTSLGSSVFYDCTGLTSITISNSVTSLSYCVFHGCTGLTSITIPDSVTSIGNVAFADCTGLTSVTIPDSVTSIGYDAFRGCTGLTSITIPDSVTSIDNAFCGCSGLTSITIPSSVTSLWYDAFWGCSGLTSITVEAGNAVYDSRNNCNAIIKTENNTLLLGCKNTVIPNSVTSIGGYAFRDCTGLTSITIPNSVTTIGSSAFEGCAKLNDVYYSGSKSDWEKITINTDNDNLTSANIHYNSQGPTDETKPTGSISSTNNVATNQTVTLSLSDNVGVAGYYWGTSSNYSSNTYTTTSSSSVSKTVSSAGTYYLTVKDTSGNVSSNYSITFYKTTLNANGGSVSPTSVLTKSGSSFTFPTPTKSGSTYNGWSTSSSATSGVKTLTPSSNATYYAAWSYVDTTKPTGSISSTNNVATSQTVTLLLADNVGVAGYYWGTSSSYSSNTYTATSSSSVTKTVSSAGTYYLTVKDTSGNVSSNYSITFYKTTLNANGGSVSPTSVLTKSGNSFTFPTPTKSGSTYNGWSTSSTATSGVKTLTPTSNSTYYAVWTSLNIYNLGEETYSFENYGDSDSPGGHCFGMAVTSSGYYLGTISKSIIGGNDNKALYSFNDSATVRKPICYYLKIQGPGPEYKSIVAGGNIEVHNSVNTKADWNSCVNYVKDHKFDNKGSLNVGMWFVDGGGHAVNFLYYKEVNGQQRIYVYDNNLPEKESYYYLGTDGYIYQSPNFFGAIKGFDLMDVNKYFSYAPEFKRNQYIYADKNEIAVENANMYYMKCGPELSSYVMYEIPEGINEVVITPLEDNAKFSYLDEEYSFGEISNDTFGKLKVATKDGVTAQSFTISTCTCKCHKDKPGFFWKLQMFFWKLFRIKKHQYCECGKAHW